MSVGDSRKPRIPGFYTHYGSLYGLLCADCGDGKKLFAGSLKVRKDDMEELRPIAELYVKLQNL